MRFVISSKTLLGRLSAVGRVVNSKNAISILDYFLFQLEDDVLIVTGSDQENTLTTRFTVEEADGGGRFAIKAKNILDMLKGMNEQNLTFEINGDNFEINIYYQNGKFNFIGLNGDEFPEKKIEESETHTFSLPAKEIAKGIDHVLFAVDSDDMRPVMMGILWDIKPEETVFVASDMNKLVRYINHNIKTGITASFILPSKPAAILDNVFPKDDVEITVKIDPNSATFIAPDYTLNCTFIKGRYPNYNSVIPANNPYMVTVDRMCLLNAVKRVGVFATVGGLIQFHFGNNEIMLKSQDLDVATLAEEKMSCDYNGEHMVVGFNYQRLTEVLSNMTDDTVELHLSDPTRPCVFMPIEQKENENVVVVLMPMML